MTRVGSEITAPRIEACVHRDTSPKWLRYPMNPEYCQTAYELLMDRLQHEDLRVYSKNFLLHGTPWSRTAMPLVEDYGSYKSFHRTLLQARVIQLGAWLIQ